MINVFCLTGLILITLVSSFVDPIVYYIDSCYIRTNKKKRTMLIKSMVVCLLAALSFTINRLLA